ncbi:hypothetical protein ACUY28_01720 [Corynebacterium sanguinis]|uniref:Uncharacterized protein n=1 Tax=Corynebacterium sanguinis TaxID=2594913 RepID=A0A6C1U231_9CORY|nr:hypothetical protein [Corynebacterium sanguinis]MBA4505085.1 hypothetical protein [Corynebacterium sanguinis]MCT1411270.1 hypothetical protein [Corynebacterium sanguinis]MCT1499889.1 hypothetical protein [Corynebacterium sanguinis]MCT1629180.1 hypothetical protein [Corynebacterium sanguinis]MCT2287507.1 hypothetical protein [Corynebacterium sanguinis]
MHYVSWDRSDKDNPKLLAENGPEVLGVFTHERATVGDQEWELVTSPESGAVATRAGEEIVRATGSLKRDKNIPVTVEGRGYALVNEWSKNWIVDDAAGNKVAQFTQDHNGVRRAILEFEGETQLPATDIAALAWVSREVLETKKMINSTALIAFLVFLSIFVVVVFLIQ